jgi:hypothetical protein
MSKKYLSEMLFAIFEKDEAKATQALASYFDSKARSMLKEDHEKSMDHEQLAHYLNTLHSKAKDEHKENFAKHLGIPECSKEHFSTCAKTLAKDKSKADRIIHKLENLVGYKIDPKEYKKDKKKGESDAKAEKDSKTTKPQGKPAK